MYSSINSRIVEGLLKSCGGYTGNERREYPKNAEGVPTTNGGWSDKVRRVEPRFFFKSSDVETERFVFY